MQTNNKADNVNSDNVRGIDLVINLIKNSTGLADPVRNNGVCLSTKAQDHMANGLNGGPKAITRPSYTNIRGKDIDGKALDALKKAMSDSGNVFVMAKGLDTKATDTFKPSHKFFYFKHVACITKADNVLTYLKA